MKLTLHDGIEQRPNAVDLDLDNVAGLERKAAVGDDAGTGEQESAGRKRVVATEPTDQILECAGHLLDARATIESNLAAAVNDKADADVVAGRHANGKRNPRPQTARLAVALGLRQIERIVALDVARAHVITDRKTDELQLARHDQRQLRF